MIKKLGKTCQPHAPDAVTANQTLIQWMPRKLSIQELLTAKETEKVESIPGVDHSQVRVAYQVPTDVTWGDTKASICGRTLEESFGLENAAWCQNPLRKSLGLKLRGEIGSPTELAAGLHKRINGKHFDKTKFALGVLTRKEEEWVVPLYIKEGLVWLEGIVDQETTQEVEAAAEGIAVTATTTPEEAINS